MYRLIIQTLCITMIYTKQASAAPANPDFSEFIEKLLSSDKLDILVDRVADKAIEKIKNLQKQKLEKFKPPPQEVYKPQQEVYKPQQELRPVEHHSNILRNVEANDEYVSTTKTPKLSQYRGQPGKIDMQAAKEKYASFPFEQLSLKYKHFTNDGPKLTSERVLLKNFEAKGGYDDNPERPEKIEDRGRVEDKVSDFDLSLEHSKSGQKFAGDEEITRVKDMFPINFVGSDFNPRIDTKQFDNNNERQFKSRIEPKQSYFGYKHIMPESLSKQFRTNEQVKPQNNQANEVSNETQENESEEKSPKAGDDKDVAEEALEENQTTSEANFVVRQEGDKIFAFQQSPDYEEYHENYERMSKTTQNVEY